MEGTILEACLTRKSRRDMEESVIHMSVSGSLEMVFH